MARPPSGPNGSPHPVNSSGSPEDLALVSLVAEPFQISRPQIQTLPFVFASGHSGQRYPQGLIAESRLDALTLRRSEDAFVDELFAGVADLGAPLIAARFPRAYCDVNRAMGELDAACSMQPWIWPWTCPAPASPPDLASFPASCAMARKSMPASFLRAKRSCGFRGFTGPIMRPWRNWRKKPASASAWRWWWIVIPCRRRFSVPDIVLGDRYGASAPPLLTGWAENAFVGGAFLDRAQRALCRRLYHDAAMGGGSSGLFGLQIEINRGLYLDEDRIQRKPGFDALKKSLTDVLAKLTAIDPALLGGRALPLGSGISDALARGFSIIRPGARSDVDRNVHERRAVL